MTEKFTFNLFTMLGPIHDAAPELTEAEITTAFDALIARGNIFAPDLSPPLTEREMLIRDVILRQAQAHHRAQAQ